MSTRENIRLVARAPCRVNTFLVACSLPSGITTAPCNGNWSTIACGTSYGRETSCLVDATLTVLEITVSQLASNALCQFHVFDSRRSVSSGRYGKDSHHIRVDGYCIAIFNVCTGKLSENCNSVYERDVSITFTILSWIEFPTLIKVTKGYVH